MVFFIIYNPECLIIVYKGSDGKSGDIILVFLLRSPAFLRSQYSTQFFFQLSNCNVRLIPHDFARLASGCF